MASELLMSVSKDEHERALIRSRRMAETDRLSNLATAEERGERRGFAKGIARGIGKGISVEREKTVLKMLSIGRPISEIRIVTDLTEAEIKEIIEQQQQ